MTDHDQVLTANRAFYQAFADRDVASMIDLWARDRPVACIHPGWTALHTRDQVLRSWRDILSNPESPRIRCRDEQVFLYGDAALVLCVELIADARLAATNVFIREHGVWRMVHHQASPIAVKAPEAEDTPPVPPHRLH